MKKKKKEKEKKKKKKEEEEEEEEEEKKKKERKKKTLFTSKLDINLRTKPDEWYIWSVAAHGFETRALAKVDQKYLANYEVSAGEGWNRAVGPIM